MSQLTIVERSTIYALRKEGKSFGYIARHLKRSKSTITREFKRNLRPRYGYDPQDAQNKTTIRRRQIRALYKFKNKRIRNYVIRLLKKRFSPDQISGRIKKDLGLSISHEAIYKFVYRDKLHGGILWKFLRHKRKQRKKRMPRNIKVTRIKNRTGIEQRPKIVRRKTRFGDLELDTIVGKGHKGAIVTIVDRCSKFLWAEFVQKATAEAVEKAIKKLLRRIKKKVKTLTSDNGSEFTNHQEIAKWAKAKFYFADPYSSWQRGLNEHTNGLIRGYYPKKTEFNKLTLKNLKKVVERLTIDLARC